MNKILKIMSLLLVLATVVFAAGCTEDEEPVDEGENNTGEAPEDGEGLDNVPAENETAGNVSEVPAANETAGNTSEVAAE